MSVQCIPPYTPLLYSKTGVCRGIPIFLIFAPKHRLWVLVRTTSARRFYHVPTIYVLSKNKKNIKIFQLKIFNFLKLKNLCILHGQIFVMKSQSMFQHVQPCQRHDDRSITSINLPTMWFPNRSDTNRAVQAQKQARSLKLQV